MENNMPDLLEAYNRIMDEKATIFDFRRVYTALTISAIGPENHLKLLKEQRAEQKKSL